MWRYDVLKWSVRRGDAEAELAGMLPCRTPSGEVPMSLAGDEQAEEKLASKCPTLAKPDCSGSWPEGNRRVELTQRSILHSWTLCCVLCTLYII